VQCCYLLVQASPWLPRCTQTDAPWSKVPFPCYSSRLLIGLLDSSWPWLGLAFINRIVVMYKDKTVMPASPDPKKVHEGRVKGPRCRITTMMVTD
jgi:hypothetical protein